MLWGLWLERVGNRNVLMFVLRTFIKKQGTLHIKTFMNYRLFNKHHHRNKGLWNLLYLQKDGFFKFTLWWLHFKKSLLYSCIPVSIFRKYIKNDHRGNLKCTYIWRYHHLLPPTVPPVGSHSPPSPRLPSTFLDLFPEPSLESHLLQLLRTDWVPPKD